MTITPTALSRSAGVAAILAGLTFIGVQIGHPHLDVTSVGTVEWTVRNTAKAVFATLGLAGITGMYLRQVKQIGLLGLIGYVVFAVGYLTIMSVAFVSAYVLPTIAETDPAYVNDLLAAATNGIGWRFCLGHVVRPSFPSAAVPRDGGAGVVSGTGERR